MIQTGIHQLLDECRVFQFAPVGIDAGDLTQAFGVGDQFGQVRPQGRLAAGEHDVRNADFPQQVEGALPGRGIHLGEGTRPGIVAVGAVVVAAVGQGQIHAVRRRRVL